MRIREQRVLFADFFCHWRLQKHEKQTQHQAACLLKGKVRAIGLKSKLRRTKRGAVPLSAIALVPRGCRCDRV